MSTLARAVIRAYNAGAHKADVQLATSIPTHLTGIPVATDIPPAYVVAGRECAVLLFDDNPDNAVVVTVHGAVPGSVGDLVVDDQLAVGPRRDHPAHAIRIHRQPRQRQHHGRPRC